MPRILFFWRCHLMCKCLSQQECSHQCIILCYAHARLAINCTSRGLATRDYPNLLLGLNQIASWCQACCVCKYWMLCVHRSMVGMVTTTSQVLCCITCFKAAYLTAIVTGLFAFQWAQSYSLKAWSVVDHLMWWYFFSLSSYLNGDAISCLINRSCPVQDAGSARCGSCMLIGMLVFGSRTGGHEVQDRPHDVRH
jgi:hypothetical protein